MSRRHRLRFRRAVVPGWAALLSLAICAPLFTRGYVLSYDMVWVPRLDIDRPEIWGLGSALPRAVPSDTVVALLDTVLPAAVVQRIVLLAALFLLAIGAARLLRDRPIAAQLAGATLAVWNPFVAERLVLGQWPLLLACAGLIWLVAALSDKNGPRWWLVVLALAGTALTPASGLMGVLLGVIAAWRRGVIRVILLAALLNGPWIVAGLRQAALSRTDPAAVGLFDLQAEGSLGKLGSALTLGGIWNTEVVPTSRTLVIAVVFSVVIGAVILAGMVTMWRDDGRLLAILSIAGVLGLAVALAGWLVPDQVARVVSDVPAGGLLRDGTRWLALLVPLEAVAFGAGVCAALHHARSASWAAPAAVLGVLLPLAALPDLAWGVGGRLEPTTYPSSWTDARRAVQTSEVRGDILILPFTAYRRPVWNNDRSVLDPAGRFFDRTTVVNDELEVSGRPIAGEDPRAARIGRILARRDARARLEREGIGIVVVETDAPGAGRALRQVDGARELDVEGAGMRVFALPGASPTAIDSRDRRMMIATWGVAGLTLLSGLVGGLRAGVRRLDRQPTKHRARQVPKP